MDDVPQRLAQWWRGLDDRGRRHASVLALISAGFVGHYLVFTIPQPFFIEDAGISFAFARNLVEGEGLVGYPGGERVEGYSNFLWTMLVAGFYAVGIPMWVSAKVMGVVFGVATLPLVYRITNRAAPTSGGRAGLLAAAMLAASTQFTLWAASGLENSLFCVLLAAGVDRLLAELADETDSRVPWSAVWFALLAMTRPEGIAYGAIAGFAMVLDCGAKRRVGQLPVWVLTLAVPLLAYHGWRYSYFAWEAPNTYYAKLGVGTRFKPWRWDTGGWKYVKNYFVRHNVVYVLPLFAVATAGLRRWTRWMGLGVVLLVGIPLFWDGRSGLDALVDPLPEAWTELTTQARWVHFRVWSIAAGVVLLGVAALGRPGWRSRGILWCVAAFATFFALYAGGDWMSQHRWFNMAVMGLVPLMALGVVELAEALGLDDFVVRAPDAWEGAPAAARRGVSAYLAVLMVAFVGWLAGEAYNSNKFANNPETSVRDIARRVRYMSWVQRRLDIDHVTLLDVDMGAHMLYSGWDIVDIAGLIDVPMARHSNFDMKFIRHYIFDERQPDFAHLHGGWERTSKISKHKEWKRRYIEIPGYPIGGGRVHPGNHINKQIFVRETGDPIPEDAPRFGRRIRLLRFEVPSPEVAAGSPVLFDTEWAASLRRHDFRILVVLDDGAGHRATVAFAPGYGWYPSDDWKTRERVTGRYRFRLPADLPEGDYKVSVSLIDEESGAVIPYHNSGEPQMGPVVYLAGEYHTDTIVRVVSPEQAQAAADADLDAALSQAAAGDCEAVWPLWRNAQRHVERRTEWIRSQDPLVRDAVATCWALKSDSAATLEERVEVLTQARFRYRHNDALLARVDEVADLCEAEADAHAAALEWQPAYQHYAWALAVDPSRSWTRRTAEDARDNWLRVVRPGRTKEDLAEIVIPTAAPDEDDG